MNDRNDAKDWSERVEAFLDPLRELLSQLPPRALADCLPNRSDQLLALVVMAWPDSPMGEAAFQHLRDRYFVQMTGVALRILGEKRCKNAKGDAPIVANQALFKLWDAGFCRHSYDFSKPLWPYLQRIVQNEARDFLRRLEKTSSLPDEFEAIARERPAEESFSELEERQRLLEKLPPKEREVVLRFEDNQTGAEIEKAMNLKRGESYRIKYDVQSRLKGENTNDGGGDTQDNEPERKIH